MKILSKFLLFSVFVFLPAVVCAQDFKFFRDCGFAPALEIYTTDGHGLVSPQIVGYLEDGQNCLNIDVMELKDKVKWLDTAVGWNTDEFKDLLDELKQTKDDLHTAETKIETLENRLTTAEDEIQELKFDSRIPLHPANRKATANRPSGFIPDTPATTPHPAIKKSDASKPKAPASKPTSGFVPDFPPMSPASKPKALDNKQTPAVKEGPH
ncbi:MAG: hypothetical protein ABSE55_01595 [Terracidiphilus sp.]|jgi:hypothetical protein